MLQGRQSQEGQLEPTSLAGLRKYALKHLYKSMCAPTVAGFFKGRLGLGSFRFKNWLRIAALSKSTFWESELWRSVRPFKPDANATRLLLCGSKPRRILSFYEKSCCWIETPSGKRRCVMGLHAIMLAQIAQRHASDADIPAWLQDVLAAANCRFKQDKG